MWTLADMKAALVRRSRLLLTIFGALSAGAIAAVLTAPLVHEGEFKLLVKRDRADAVVSGAPADMVQAEELSESELNSQVELLKAQDLQEKVVVESGLTSRLIAEGDAASEPEALAKALKILERNLTVTPIRKTWLIDVTYRDEDPKVTKKVLDTMVQAFFDKHLTLHRPAGTFEFFSEQVVRARQELEAAQQALVQFSQQYGVVSADAEKQAALAKLTEFEALRAQAQAALAEASRRQVATSAELTHVPQTRTAQTRITQNAGAVEQIQSKILELELRRSEMLQRFTPEYRGVVETEQQLREARAALAQALDTKIHEQTVADNPTRQWLDTELVRARTDNAALQGRVQALSGAVARYRAEAQRLELRSTEQQDLERRLAAAEERYRLYVAKQEEARISDELDKTRIANVAIAQAPSLKREPKRSPSLAMLPLLIIVALMLSTGLVLGIDAFSMPSVPATTEDRIAALARSTATVNASFAARLDELKKLTDTVADRWTRPQPEPRRAGSGETGWRPVPAADGLRQGA